MTRVLAIKSLLAFAVIFTCLSLPSAPAHAETPSNVKRVLAQFADEPSIQDVHKKVIDYERLHPELVESWYTRVRLRALAPELRARGQFDADQSERKVDDPDAGETEVKDDGNLYRVWTQLDWDFARLVFEPEELKATSAAIKLGGRRDKVLEEATRRYFDRRRLQVELELSPPSDLAERVKKELRLQELTADLDALTGGWFSDKLKNARARS